MNRFLVKVNGRVVQTAWSYEKARLKALSLAFKPSTGDQEVTVWRQGGQEPETVFGTAMRSEPA